MRDKMLAFMSGHDYCVISTVGSDSKPESAFVAFSHNGLDVVIGTSNKSRKFANLTANSSVAIVIADETGEIQYEGQASVVSAQDFSAVEAQHIAKLPGAGRYRNDPTQEYVRITPTWIRFIEHGDSDQIEEYTEF